MSIKPFQVVSRRFTTRIPVRILITRDRRVFFSASASVEERAWRRTNMRRDWHRLPGDFLGARRTAVSADLVTLA